MTCAAAALLLALAAPATGDGTFKTGDGVSIYYRSVGEGAEAVVIPIAALTSPAFDGLAKGRRVVYYDPRGRGRSELGPLESVSFERAAKDLEELRVHLGLERMALVGFSGSGMEMALYALAHPGRVSRLVQLAPIPPSFRPWGEEASAARQARLDQQQMKEFERLKTEKAPGEAQCRALQKGMLPAVVAYPERFVEKDFDYCANPNEWPENTGKFYGKLLSTLGSQDVRPLLPGLKFPRLVIHASKDTFPQAGSEAWVRGQAEARLLVIEDAGHAAWRDQPKAVLAAIETFLAGGWPEGSRELPASP